MTDICLLLWQLILIPLERQDPARCLYSRAVGPIQPKLGVDGGRAPRVVKRVAVLLVVTVLLMTD